MDLVLWETGQCSNDSVCLLNVDRDTICDMGGAAELANYGEYSGAPSEQQTYDYAKTLLGLMCKQVHLQGMYVCLLVRKVTDYHLAYGITVLPGTGEYS